MDTANLLDDFIIEASGHVDKLEAAFLNAQGLEDDPQALEEVYRAAHSLKGMAGFFQLSAIVSLSHSIENILSALRNKSLALKENNVDTLLQAVDCLREMVREPKEDEDTDISGYLSALDGILHTPPQATSASAPAVPDAVTLYHIPDDIKEILPGLIKRGQKIYRINLAFEKALGVYFHYPRQLFENIASVGAVLYAHCGLSESRDVQRILRALEKGKNTTLELIVASVLEHDLLVIALELPPQTIEPIALEAEKPPVAPTPPPPPKRKKSSTGDDLIRLGVSQVNQLVDLTGQLVLTRNQLLSAMDKHRNAIPGLTSILQEISRITTELQDKVMQTRMQPISSVFTRFPRVIRDMARKLGKELELEIAGDDIALDKMLIEALVDPLTHIVRNAADHGIEAPDARKKAGKPPVGKIRLRAYMKNNMVTIEAEDDGAGIDMEVVKAKALEKGLISQREFDEMTEEEASELLFRQGVSTSAEVTDVSGRGIGMDVVKTNIEKLSGTIEIASRIGEGTRVRLRLPRTLAIVPSLIASIGGVLCAIPQMYIEHIVRMNPQQETKAKTLGNIHFLYLNDAYLPAISLATLHEAAGRTDWPTDEGDHEIAIIIQQEEVRFALMATSVIGLEETLAKPLPTLLRDCPCYSGVTILGSGHAVPILDPVGVARMLALEAMETSGEEAAEPAQNITDVLFETLVLFQCSGNEHYAVPISEILRIEAVEAENLQTIGENVYINVGESTVRVLRPEDFLPVQKKAYGDGRLYLMLPKRGGGLTGFLIRKVLFHEKLPMRIDESQFDHPCLHGTVQYNEKILLLPKLDEMINSAEEKDR